MTNKYLIIINTIEMEELNYEQMETTQGGKFLGVDESCSQCFMGHQTCTSQFYLFWVSVGDSWVSYDGIC